MCVGGVLLSLPSEKRSDPDRHILAHGAYGLIPNEAGLEQQVKVMRASEKGMC